MTTQKVGRWALRPNPAYTGKPRLMMPMCHDRSPFITIVCQCGAELHQHETQTAPIPDDVEIASRCLTCGDLLVFPPGWFRYAFAQLRDQGWVA